MEFSRFTPAAFEALASDAEAVRHLADELEAAVLLEVSSTAGERFRQLVARLRVLGHQLTDYGPQGAGELHVRDCGTPNRIGLRLALDLVVSAGYQDVVGDPSVDPEG